MAFLDNSGDIILDAVLTEVGRKRLAQATRTGGTAAKITHFALGDDEINYSSYNLNSPSGSNYADLEILQTPILQAFTCGNANINYGLLKLRNPDLLYLPSLRLNTLPSSNFVALQQYLPTGLTGDSAVYLMAVNQTTYDALVNTEGIASAKVGFAYNQSNGPHIYVEGGLNTTELSKDKSNKFSYINNLNTSNGTYSISVDSRLSKAVYTCNGAGAFANNKSNGTDLRESFQVSQRSPISSNSLSTHGENYSSYTANSVNNKVVEPDINGPATLLSSLLGPGDTVTCFKFTAKDGLRSDIGTTADPLYAQMGFVNLQAAYIFNGSSSGFYYDIIDTVVYVVGQTTGGSISIPIRLIRRRT
tara:strand:+ start:37 stop:1119 length:1083 start_codon:yes stop_codon:yes gene_type:complete